MKKFSPVCFWKRSQKFILISQDIKHAAFPHAKYKNAYQREVKFRAVSEPYHSLGK
jgi:hypothetical protein